MKYLRCDHTGTIYSSSYSGDAAGGHAATFAVRQSGVRCQIDTASAAERERFAQAGMTVTHQVSLLTSTLTSTPQRGDKFVASNGASFHIVGIRTVRAGGTVPSFTYFDSAEEQL